MSPLSNDPTQTESAGHNRNYYDELVKTKANDTICQKPSKAEWVCGQHIPRLLWEGGNYKEAALLIARGMSSF